MVTLSEKPENYLDKNFMMGIFDSIKPDLPPFVDYLDHMFTDKKTVSIGNKEVLLSKLRDKLFDQSESNQDCTEYVLKLVKVSRVGFKQTSY